MAAPTVIFACGGECAALAHWSGKTATIVTRDTGTKHSGAASIKIAAAGAAADAIFNFSSAAHVVSRLALYLDGLPVADAVFAYSDGSGNNAFFGFDVATSKLCVFEQGHWANRVLGPVLVTRTWTLIDLHFAHSGTFTITWKVDGSAQSTLTGVETAARTFGDFVIGQASGGGPANATYNAYYDDIVVSVTATDYPIASGTVTGTTTEVWTVTVATAKPNFVPFFWA